MQDKRKIYVVHASVGSGHKTAANAVALAIDILNKEASMPVEYEPEVLDILPFGRIKFDGNKYATTFTGATRPLYDFTWRYTFTGRFLWGGGTNHARVMYPEFTQKVREEEPAAIVCTHIVAANTAVGARMITGQNFPIICVPTDYEVEGLWPHEFADVFCVANEQMAETLRARHVPEHKIKITGMPTNPEFTKEYDRDEVCESFNLPADKKLVLAVAGASLLQPYVHIKKVIQDLVPYMHEFKNLHFVIVVGRDGDLKQDLKAFIAEHGIENITVLGYVEEMAMLLSACDLVVCKAGGMTVTECLCAYTPMILTCRAYGQEKANVKMLTAAGAAIHVTTSRELYATLKVADSDYSSFEALKKAAENIRKPYASLDIAKETFFAISNSDDETLRERTRKTFISFYIGDKPAHPR
ncbi:MAG: glycosyltransferase [Phoenicibacter congonensis]|uniref:Glycosyltransferase n=1 Tax=Phoenicibacter congonensis TaxID=1944646 RepID=A0AA43RHC7_9ACTN|nr:glycosyltransferase [Phoenicibacter congonensis]